MREAIKKADGDQEDGIANQDNFVAHSVHQFAHQGVEEDIHQGIDAVKRGD